MPAFIPPENRETGAMPVRTRHCIQIVEANHATGIFAWEGGLDDDL